MGEVFDMMRAKEVLARLDAALAFDKPNGTDREWSVLLAEALNAQTFIADAIERASEGLPADWTPWPGGECPVPLDTIVDIKWNNGAVSRATRAGLYTEGASDLWTRNDPRCYIAAYRLAA